MLTPITCLLDSCCFCLSYFHRWSTCHQLATQLSAPVNKLFYFTTVPTQLLVPMLCIGYMDSARLLLLTLFLSARVA